MTEASSWSAKPHSSVGSASHSSRQRGRTSSGKEASNLRSFRVVVQDLDSLSTSTASQEDVLGDVHLAGQIRADKMEGPDKDQGHHVTGAMPVEPAVVTADIVHLHLYNLVGQQMRD